MTVPATVAAFNAGSSTLKFAVFAVGAGDPVAQLRGHVDQRPGQERLTLRDGAGRMLEEQPLAGKPGRQAVVRAALAAIDRHAGDRPLEAIGHRVVHGGTRFREPVVVSTDVFDALEALTPLAPLHQPASLAVLRALMAERSSVPHVACFDTAFHATQPELATRLALPERFAEQGIRRYGFHGLSYESVARQLARLDRAAHEGRTIVLHLGAGASLCAMAKGRSVATTMGFSTLDGVPMATRSGSLDPGVLIHLLTAGGMDVPSLEHLLYHEAGLAGVSGASGDVRDLESSADPRARLALDLFEYRIAREIGSLAAALGGLDALVFTGGIGENSVGVRARVCERTAWLGLRIDGKANERHRPRISEPSSRITAWVVHTDEEQVIAARAAAVRDSRSA